MNDTFEEFYAIIDEFCAKHDMRNTELCFHFGRLIDMMIENHEDDAIDQGICYDDDEDGAMVIGTFLCTVLFGLALPLKQETEELS